MADSGALRYAFELVEKGQFAEAERICRDALQADPKSLNAAFLLGVTAFQSQRYSDALKRFEAAIDLRRNEPLFHYNHGLAAFHLGRFEDAARSYEMALRLRPDYSEALYNCALAYHKAGNLDRAKDNLALLVVRHPQSIEALANLGAVYLDMGRTEDAIGAYRKATSLDPNRAELHYSLGVALLRFGDPGSAEHCFRAALVRNAGFAPALNDLGVCLMRKADAEEAITYFESAVHADPENPVYLYHMGIAEEDLGHFDQALKHYDAALDCDPAYVAARVSRLNLRKQMCDWRDFDTDITTIRRCVPDQTGLIDPFVLLSLPGATAAEQQLCARAWSAKEAGKRAPALGSNGEIARHRVAGRQPKTRLGYVSADFGDHPNSYLSVGVFELHDRAQFEVFAYSWRPNDGSPIRQRIENAFDRFTDLAEEPLSVAAARIRDDKVDILVDIQGHTKANRFGLLPLRPAPVQVHYLAYPGTTGTPYIDYLIADRFVVPEEAAGFYDEKLALLPHCYQPQGRKQKAVSSTRAEWGLPDDAFVFCCFNNTYKITPEVFDVWCGLLASLPGSVLWLLESNEQAPSNLRRAAARHGIEATRLVFAPRVPHVTHLGRIALADLALDTVPYGAHTTASDALWAGVPMISCVGNTFASRVSGSILTAAGLSELLTQDLREYYGLARRLASDKERLQSLRERLSGLERTTLGDSRHYVRNLEALYQAMWDRYLKGHSPDHIDLR